MFFKKLLKVSDNLPKIYCKIKIHKDYDSWLVDFYWLLAYNIVTYLLNFYIMKKQINMEKFYFYTAMIFFIILILDWISDYNHNVEWCYMIISFFFFVLHFLERHFPIVKK
jgi:hypothetical protein